MNLRSAAITLITGAAFSSFINSAEIDPNAYSPLEMAAVTIRMTGGHPYGEFYPCPEGCALRLLPFTPNARIYIDGLPITPRSLQHGQQLIGTMFLTSQPIDAIDQIVAQ